MIENHYGVTVNSEVPVTGVFQNNHVEYLYDELMNGVDLSYEGALDYYVEEKLKDIVEFAKDMTLNDIDKLREMLDELEEPDLDCVESTEYLIGFIETDNPKEAWFWFDHLGRGYILDPDADCSAIVGECYTQVIRSKYVLRGNLCSPCYPGQVDADSEGFYLGYSLPPDFFVDENPMKKRIRRIDE